VPTRATGCSRYPDVTIDCCRYQRGSNDATSTTIVFEVLSKTTRWCDQSKKLDVWGRTNGCCRWTTSIGATLGLAVESDVSISVSDIHDETGHDETGIADEAEPARG
jgi:hypothetical protein